MGYFKGRWEESFSKWIHGFITSIKHSPGIIVSLCILGFRVERLDSIKLSCDQHACKCLPRLEHGTGSRGQVLYHKSSVMRENLPLFGTQL